MPSISFLFSLFLLYIYIYTYRDFMDPLTEENLALHTKHVRTNIKIKNLCLLSFHLKKMHENTILAYTLNHNYR
ncbi:uncharacterized protein B0P05DRAFT_86828 [Gilbertella persicaria]|uniref:uncharacterized protein n=1 Tax=Gilbertella persicaria TaxID=101096 RepID=UPI0022206EF6|nr:uncharacterized protein B0P05DRAFT_86828 [Gilbertella persicaria]KAI8079582.1 hypothetical protein B0P05DRAFT_86828 [Gilbertella persicaria]